MREALQENRRREQQVHQEILERACGTSPPSPHLRSRSGRQPPSPLLHEHAAQSSSACGAAAQADPDLDT